MKATDQIAYSRLGEYARRVDSVITRLMADKLAHPEMLSLAAGFTDNRILPEDLVRQAMENLSSSEKKSHLQYGMNRGRPGLRKAVIDLLQTYPGEENLGLTDQDVLITNGSQQGLYILVQMLCNPGDMVLVEQPSYFVFLELLHGLGVKPVSMPMDQDGRIDGGALESMLESFRKSGELSSLKLVYLMGTFANPSTRCINEGEKADLLRVLGSLPTPVPVIEDMAYRELYFDEPYPARSLLAIEGWKNYPVIYTGTFTKPFATGMKVGFMVSRHADCLTTVAKIKGHQDFGTAHMNQAILENVLQEGEYEPHLRSIRGHYREKRDILIAALEENELPAAGWSWQLPEGGLLLWAKGPDSLDTRIGSEFHRNCLSREILYVPGDLCFAGGEPFNFVRLSFGALESELIPEATRRFCLAAKQTVSGY